MTLGFSQEFKGVKNFFVEKIWTGLDPLDPEVDYYWYRDEYFEKFHNYWDGAWTGELETQFKPKLHTIRQGIGRWRAGMDIHMVINNRTSNRFQFAPTIKCKGVQKIEINWAKGYPLTRLDGKLIDGYDLKKLAINDGFDTVDDFFAYFNEDFTGTLIHWTDLKY